MSEWARWFGWILIVFFIGGGVWLRLQIAQEPLWLDELHTGYCVSGTGSVTAKALIGNQSPFYFWLVALTQPLTDSWNATSELALRTMSLAAGIMLQILAAYFCWSWTRSTLATVLVTFYVAFDSNLIFYATEARPYVLVQLLGLVQVGLFVKLISNFRWQVAGASAVVSALLFYSHYTAASLFTAEILFLVITLLSPQQASERKSGTEAETGLEPSNRTSRAIGMWTFYWASVALLCSAAIPHLLELIGRKNYWASVSSVAGLGGEFIVDVSVWVLPAWCLWMVGHSKRVADNLPTHRMLTLISLWSVVPTVLILGFDTFGFAPLALSRYSQVGILGFAFGVPLVIGAWRFDGNPSTGELQSTRIMQGVVGAFFVAACVFNNSYLWKDVAQLSIPQVRNENWREAIAAANELGKQNRDRIDAAGRIPLFLFANVLEDAAARKNLAPEFQEYLTFPVNNVYSIDQTSIDIQACPTLSEQPFTSEQIEQVRSVGTCLLLIRVTPERAAFIVDSLNLQLGLPASISKLGDRGSPLILVRIQIQVDSTHAR